MDSVKIAWWCCALLALGILLSMCGRYLYPEPQSPKLAKEKTLYYLNLEDRFRTLRNPDLFVSSIHFKRGAGSAFVVKLYDRYFIMTASHIVEDQRGREQLVLKSRSNSLDLKEKFTVSFMNDIAAFEIPETVLTTLGMKSWVLYSLPENLLDL